MTFILTLTVEHPSNQIMISPLRMIESEVCAHPAEWLTVLSSSHGRHLFRVSASNRHRILLMLTCRSQSEAKPLSRLALTAYSLQRASSEPSASRGWGASNLNHRLPFLVLTTCRERKRNSSVCMCSDKDRVTDYTSEDGFQLWKQRAG